MRTPPPLPWIARCPQLSGHLLANKSDFYSSGETGGASHARAAGDGQQAVLKAMILRGRDPERDGVSAWWGDGIGSWNVGDMIAFDGTTWDKIDGITNEVTSVAGLVGPITAAALKTALAIAVADVSGAAPLASPGLSGTPTAPTAAAGSISTQIANTAFVAGRSAPDLIVEDQKACGTSSGTAVTGWQTRTLNTVVRNTISGASLASNLITLPAGTYYVEASSVWGTGSGFSCGTRSRIRNASASSDIAYGMNEEGAAAYGSVRSFVDGVFTLGSAQSIELDAYLTGVTNSNGSLGYPTSISGVAEIYARVKIWRLA